MKTETITQERLEKLAADLGLEIERDPNTDESFIKVGNKQYRAHLPKVVSQ